MYLKKRFDGEREACEQYEEFEIIEIPDDMDINTYILIENMKHQNVVRLLNSFMISIKSRLIMLYQ